MQLFRNRYRLVLVPSAKPAGLAWPECIRLHPSPDPSPSGRGNNRLYGKEIPLCPFPREREELPLEQRTLALGLGHAKAGFQGIDAGILSE